MIAGEAGPEAIIPLPDGRNVPVQLQGAGTSSNVTVNLTVQAVDAQSFQNILRRNPGAFRSLLQEAIESDVPIRNEITAIR